MKLSVIASRLALIWALFSIPVVTGQSTKDTADPLRAVAVLHPTEGNNAAGVVTFTEVEDGVRVDAEVHGLTPGKHGFHVHEFGDCRAADASSAGDHFNPEHRRHGSADALERHVGDMGNIEADASGVAKLDHLDHHMSLADDERSIIGRAVIVDAHADDGKSQPNGGISQRVACGVIGRAATK